MDFQLMLADFGKAVAQFTDPKFSKTVFKALFLTAALLLLCIAPFYGFLALVLPETLHVPYLGTYHPEAWLDEIAIGLAIFALAFLMFPVAFLIVGFFLDDIAEAVEMRHYPHLPRVEPLGIWEILGDATRFFLVMIFANLLALVIYFSSNLLAPFIFWLVNGYLLGREYFQLVAMRRLGRSAATKLRRANGGKIWVAGILMAIPLSVPILNILVPLLGVATFTHLFHRLSK